MGGMTEKTCTRCKECKPVAAFQPDYHKVSGYASACKACRNAARRKGGGVANAWTDAEVALVLAQYATLGPHKLSEMMPDRSYRAIKSFAERRGLMQPPKRLPWQREYEPPPEWAIAAENALRNFKPCTPAANGPRYLIGAMG